QYRAAWGAHWRDDARGCPSRYSRAAGPLYTRRRRIGTGRNCARRTQAIAGLDAPAPRLCFEREAREGAGGSEPTMRSFELDVVATRGGVVESRHRVHAAVVDVRDCLAAGAGEPRRFTHWRSCAKPFQIMPLLQSGGFDDLHWGD